MPRAYNPKSFFSKPRSVRPSGRTTAREARLIAARDAYRARCCYCGKSGPGAGLLFVEVSVQPGAVDAHLGDADEYDASGAPRLFHFEWRCAGCRQGTLFAP